ncbi:hypothetical protein B0H14DRAFT_3425835 [Mycena olivaceomarginata]|nr:hypothetical protein B0H14DRAFT_3425835 [Mycena olivaceomarginata]
MPFGVLPYNNGVLLCIPIYKADLGHEDRDAHTGGFYAVVHPEWMGVVTSGESLARQLNRYLGACTFSAFTWSRFHDLWTLDCSEYHNHENESPKTCTRHSLQAIRMKEEEKRVKKEEMEYLAATRPLPIPLSPRRAPHNSLVVINNLPPSSQHNHRPCDNIHAVCGERMENEPHLYAVSGHSRVFRSKDRTIHALQDTPSAKLFWSCDPKEVWSFIAEARDWVP